MGGDADAVILDAQCQIIVFYPRNQADFAFGWGIFAGVVQQIR